MRSSAHRVARRFVAEILTKAWLMGVRRGWLALIATKPSGWIQVFKAFDKLNQFLLNLEEEVMFTRRSGVSSTESMEQDRLKALFKKAREALGDQRGKAKFWYGIQTGTSSMPGGSHSVEDAEKMLRLYETNFASTLTVSVRTRRNEFKRQFNTEREASITELVDDILEFLRKEAATLAESMKINPEDTQALWGDPVYREFDIHGMKVVLDDKTITAGLYRNYIKYLDETYQKIRAKGFSKVWYGTVFIKCKDCGGINPYGKSYGVGGDYPIGADVVNIYSRPDSTIPRLLIHELGHRYWYKGMNNTQRERFKSLIKTHKRLPRARRGLDPHVTDVDLNAAWLNDLRDRLSQIAKTPDIARDTARSFKSWAGAIRETLFTFTSNTDIPPKIDQDRKGVLLETNRLLSFLTDSAAIEAHPVEAAARGLALVNALDEAAQRFVRSMDSGWDAAREEEYLSDPRVPPVSIYGQSNPDEAFAEAFMHYILERNMSQDQIESFRAVLG